MTSTIVLDTSVLIKWFRQREVLAENALAFRTTYLDGTVHIAVPALVAYELTNVLRYKQELSTVQVENAVQSLFDMEFTWHSPASSTVQRAARIARMTDTTVYDATFVALAEVLPAPFVTADETLVRRVDESFPFVRFLGDAVPTDIVNTMEDTDAN